jgi:anti-sigma factor RsiW
MNDCQKTQKIITEAVDNRLGEFDRNFFNTHINDCPACRNDYELDSLTKAFIKNKITRHKTPENVALRIRQEIEKQAVSGQRSVRFFTKYPLARAAMIGMLVLGVAFIIYLLNFPASQTTVQAADMMDQSIENYVAFLAGAIQPAEISQNADELRDYFGSRVDFPVVLKPVTGCEWVGGVFSNYEGLPLAHLVYKMPAGIIYVFQANWNDVRNGNKISLSNNVVSSLDQTGWYVNGTHEEYNVVMWIYNDETVCTAVSSMEKAKLQELFASNNNGEW